MIETTRIGLARNLSAFARVQGVSVKGAASDIARMAGVSVSDIDDILDGRMMPTYRDIGSLASIAGAMGLAPTALLCRSTGLLSIAPVTKAEAPPDDSPSYRFIMSTNQVDRANDVVEQAWELADFMANPVALYNHASWQPAVGIWSDLKVESLPSGLSRLVGTVRPMPIEEYRDSVIVAKHLQMGLLRTVSVGFMPGEWRPRSGLPADHPLYSKESRGYILGSQVAPNRLMECSLCTIPMNPGAVIDSAPKAVQDTIESSPSATRTLAQALAEAMDSQRRTTPAAALGRAFKQAKEAK